MNMAVTGATLTTAPNLFGGDGPSARPTPSLQPKPGDVRIVQAQAPATRSAPAAPPQILLRADPNNPQQLSAQPNAVELSISPRIEHGARRQTHAIVLHMNGGSAAGTLANYRSSSVGAQFLITREGKIIQTMNMDQTAHHVGLARPKGYVPTPNGGNQRVDANLTAAARAIIDRMELGVKDPQHLPFKQGLRQLAALEAKKPYGNDPNDANTRLPNNSDSIGIEFEARVGRDGNYESLTDAQVAAGRALVDFLKARYGLGDADVHEHPKVSYKQYTEALGAAARIRQWPAP
jgi:N-acetylmuramoyl-L-alanine amidase